MAPSLDPGKAMNGWRNRMLWAMASALVGGPSVALATGSLAECPALQAGLAAEWQPHPSAAGVRVAYLVGRPSEQGFFKYRLQFPAGFALPPHVHGVALHTTVLCGSLSLQLGPPGQASFQQLDAGMHRVFEAALVHAETSPNGAVLEITGLGPVTTTMLEVQSAAGTDNANRP